MIRGRLSKIYKAGRGAFKGTPTPGQDNLLRAMAAMIAEATEMRPPAKKAKPKDAPKLPFGPGELYEECKARVPHIIACEPYNKRWFSALGKRLQDTVGLQRDDMNAFVSWVEGGGLDFGDSWTFDHVVKHWSTWMAKARSGDYSFTNAKGMEDYL
jgi:hypothetical protein